ncbi:MAG: exodeoxyribonuclease VII large subunit [Elusimicrobia bacterium]|nr:MAG: exodeoxyribonuclease VII large subunit [Elusimicrobiota bacterium]
MEEPRKIYKVSEINKIAKNLLEEEFPEIWLEGEISNFTLHSSGHLYFSLKDEDAQINAIMYKWQAGQLEFVPENGMKVIAQGKISVFVKGGRYQIIVYGLKPIGIGALQQAFEQLKRKLEREGLFDKARKRPIPMLPQKIGIVTSPTGAAIRDILNIIERRFANVHILIHPVRVQGDRAAGEIAEAIAYVNERFPSLDVLIVGRGGGSLEDLWPFNREIVARAIYNSRIPVISAVGHEVDYTIADFVADLRAPTPSAAAELVVTNKIELEKKILLLTSKIKLSMKHELDELTSQYRRLVDSRIFLHPEELYSQFQQEIDYYLEKITSKCAHFLDFQKERLNSIAGKLNVLSPLNILARGYSIAYKLPENEILKSISQVTMKDKVKVKLHRGEIICTVEETDIPVKKESEKRGVKGE